MLVRTDDEVYRVDSVWLGPPRATFPWRARYVSYGLGLLVMILIMFLQRRVGIGLDFFSVAWALLGTVLVTRFLGKRIDFERPLGQVLALFQHEVAGPRRRTAPSGGPVRFGHVKIRGREGALGPARATPATRTRASGSTPRPGQAWQSSAHRTSAGQAPSPGASPSQTSGRQASNHEPADGPDRTPRKPARVSKPRREPGRPGAHPSGSRQPGPPVVWKGRSGG